MIVLRRGEDGRPRGMVFTHDEALVAEVHSRLMDHGFDQGTALSILMGAGPIPTIDDGNHDHLDAALKDDDFLAYLAT